MFARSKLERCCASESTQCHNKTRQLSSGSTMFAPTRNDVSIDSRAARVASAPHRCLTLAFITFDLMAGSGAYALKERDAQTTCDELFGEGSRWCWGPSAILFALILARRLRDAQARSAASGDAKPAG